ncbi:MAG: rod-binding protein [Campylobacterales bacterium]|nr:rod-binding protein [Campylobacterales bacterium]
MQIQTNFDLANLQAERLSGVDTKTKDDLALKKVCNDFESFFMNQILETSLKSSKLAGESTGSEIFKGMYTDTLSQSSAGSLGISEMLYKFLSEKTK